ncbi:MAG: hypothetical protein Q4E26_02415 [Prevotellaceae bacterium]|nr:hypothetical protein [Prevotellaceae bacterium]
MAKVQIKSEKPTSFDVFLCDGAILGVFMASKMQKETDGNFNLGIRKSGENRNMLSLENGLRLRK